MHTIRSAGRALIRRGDSIIVVRYLDQRGHWHVLPGGGQQYGEDLEACVQRECLEELGARVRVGPLRFVRECITDRHPSETLPDHLHQVEHIFECEIEGDSGTPVEMDPTQVDWIWMKVTDLAEVRFFPSTLTEHLLKAPVEGMVYLGCTP